MSKSLGRVVLLLTLFFPLSTLASVRKDIQALYIEKYENKAMFLKIPIQGLRQVVYANESGIERGATGTGFPWTFQVGEQVRIVDLRFRSDVIHLKFSSVDLSREGELLFRFPRPLQSDFLQEPSFDNALKSCFTEGISYTDIESAKVDFIKSQYHDLISHLASATGTSSNVVVGAISERNPKYQKAVREAEEVRQRVQTVQSELEREKVSRQSLQSQLSNLQAQRRESQSKVQRLMRERDRTSQQRRSLEKQLAGAQEQNRTYERQINQLASSLDVEGEANINLGQRVAALNESLISLKNERTTLSQKLEQATIQLEELRKNNDRLSADLKKVKRARSRLASNLRALTSDRNSLESRYLETKSRKEVLETSWALQSALRLQKRGGDETPDGLVIADLFLLEQRVAVLEAQVPDGAGAKSRVTFRLESPDSVRYSDEERRLYESLGEKWTVETAWISSSSALEPRLVGGDLRQQPAAREQATWYWVIEGQPVEPQPANLLVRIVNKDGQMIELPIYEVTMMPGGWMASLRRISPVPIVMGAILGFALFAFISRFRRRPPVPHTDTHEEYVTHKKL